MPAADPTVTWLPVALVVDPDPAAASELSAMATMAGFQTAVAESVTAALVLARRLGVDLVIAEAEFVDGDVLTLARELREFSEAHLLVASTNTEEVDVVAALHAGADDHVAKNVPSRVLRAKLEAVRRRCSAAGANPVRITTRQIAGDVVRERGLRMPAP